MAAPAAVPRPAAGGGGGGDARSALLDGIQGFKKGGLKKTQTKEGPKIGPSGYSGSSSGSARAATPDSSAEQSPSRPPMGGGHDNMMAMISGYSKWP